MAEGKHESKHEEKDGVEEALKELRGAIYAKAGDAQLEAAIAKVEKAARAGASKKKE